MATTLALSAGLAFAADAPLRVAGEPYVSAAPKRLEAWRSPELTASGGAVLRLAELPAERVAALRKRNTAAGTKAVQIGVPRDYATEALQAAAPVLNWKTLADGSRVARLAVVSPGAKALRVGLKWAQLPADAELRFAGSGAPGKVLGTISGGEAERLRDDAGEYWTPVTTGERQEIEVVLPAKANADAVRLDLGMVSHLLTTQFERRELAKAVGDSGSCESNSVCRTDLGQGYINATKAVAHMIFTQSGRSYVCTGTLLNDTDGATSIPYFYSANHCISSQTVANTLNTWWFYEAASCGDTTSQPASTVQLTGGATMLYNNRDYDALLLRLNQSPPSGAYFAGWDASEVANGTQATAIHHPAGDMKKVSFGASNGMHAVSGYGGSFIGMTWSQGTTEGGSSGSGLFTVSNGGYFLRGGLYGGEASCQNTGQSASAGNQDYYSRLDSIYPNVKQYLAPTSNSGPTRDYSGAWYNPSESGWGVLITQYASNAMFIAQFVYASNREPIWWVVVNGSWTGADKFSGTLAKYTGPGFGPTFDASQVSSTTIGSATLTFTSATAATLEITANGVGRTVQISKMAL